MKTSSNNVSIQSSEQSINHNGRTETELIWTHLARNARPWKQPLRTDSGRTKRMDMLQDLKTQHHMQENSLSSTKVLLVISNNQDAQASQIIANILNCAQKGPVASKAVVIGELDDLSMICSILDYGKLLNSFQRQPHIKQESKWVVTKAWTSVARSHTQSCHGYRSAKTHHLKCEAVCFPLTDLFQNCV